MVSIKYYFLLLSSVYYDEKWIKSNSQNIINLIRKINTYSSSFYLLLSLK